MSFFGFLFLFFLGYFIIWPLVKLLIRANAVRNQFRRAAGGAAGSYAHEPERKAGWSRAGVNRRRKKIEKDVGEYVAFTEEPAQPSEQGPAADAGEREQQIVDVEWEDIK